MANRAATGSRVLKGKDGAVRFGCFEPEYVSAYMPKTVKPGLRLGGRSNFNMAQTGAKPTRNFGNGFLSTRSTNFGNGFFSPE